MAEIVAMLAGAGMDDDMPDGLVVGLRQAPGASGATWDASTHLRG